MIKADNFSLQQYLQRIHYDGDCRRDIETIAALMTQQLMHIPFENIDVLKGVGISMKPEDIVDKLIQRQRGGYCFELNGLFTQALQALDIPYQLIGARPYVRGEQKPRTHLALAVELDHQRWLCDLGFGRYGIRQPLKLSQLEKPIRQGHDRFMLSLDNEGIYTLKSEINGNWVEQYEFDLVRQDWIDFIPANHFTSTHPESIFVNNLILVLYTQNGRKIMSNHVFKRYEGQQQQVREINPQDMSKMIRTEFNLPY